MIELYKWKQTLVYKLEWTSRSMTRQIIAGDKTLDYEFQYKKVKNINLRIKPCGTVCVSANRRIPIKVIDDFVLSKADFIKKAQAKFSSATENENKRYFTDAEIRGVISGICEKVYPYYDKLGVKYPVIKFRKMVSQWGNCRAEKGILTFNTNLVYASYECIDYVVLHEFTHFLQQNHSAQFYSELEKVCPDWKALKTRLKEINLRIPI